MLAFRNGMESPRVRAENGTPPLQMSRRQSDRRQSDCILHGLRETCPPQTATMVNKTDHRNSQKGRVGQPPRPSKHCAEVPL